MLSDETIGAIMKDALAEVSDAIRIALAPAIQQAVEDLFEVHGKGMDIFHSAIIQSGIQERLAKHAATEIGNRLRCNVYDAGAVNRAFDAVWQEQYDVAMRDRVRVKVMAMVDEVIKERLANL